MQKTIGQEPLVSITLPLAREVDLRLLQICLQSISSQTYRNFELLIMLSDGASNEVRTILDRFNRAKVFENALSKSAARNFLASKASGEYMLYMGAHSELGSELLREFVTIALTRDSLAVISPQRGVPEESFWAKCRALEKNLISGDPFAEGPSFLKLSIFREIGGFEESLDPLDDWALNAKLRKLGISFDRAQAPTIVRETSSLLEMARRKYLRGKMIPALVEMFPEIPHLRMGERFIDEYLRNWRLLVGSPITTVGLLLLKIIDVTALSLGRLNSRKTVDINGSRAYLRREIADSYDEIRLGNNFNQYKHYAEVSSLLSALDCTVPSLLEVGSGTGRITAELEGRGINILPVDPSPAMLAQLVAKHSLSKLNSVLADGMALPFDQNSFTGSLSLRVIWHLPNMHSVQNMIAEMSRVSSKFVILDISNRDRWHHPILRQVANLYFMLRPNERNAHNTSRLLTLEMISQFADQMGLQLEMSLPLDVLSPVWLNLVPASLAKSLYPSVHRLDSRVGQVIPPGRFLIRLAKSLRLDSGQTKAALWPEIQ